MLSELIDRSSGHVASFSRATRAKRIVMLLMIVVGFLVGLAYQVYQWQSGSAASTPARLLYHLALLVGYGSLWGYLSLVFSKRQPAPNRAFWTTLVSGIVVLTACRLILLVPPVPTPGNDAPGLLNGIPIEPATILKMNVLAFLQITLGFVVLLRFRDLVLYKRTTSSIRNWRLMLGLMTAGSLLMVFRTSDEAFGYFVLGWLPALVLMVMNSFRLSWMLYLTTKEKMITIGLAALLILVLMPIVMLDQSSLLPGAMAYVGSFSPVLGTFVLLSILFGILYCTTAALSLLFHLPTTGAFRQKVGEVAAMHSLTTLVSQAFDAEMLSVTIASSPVEAGLAHRSWLAVADPQSGSLKPQILASSNIERQELDQTINTGAFYEELYLKRQHILLDQAALDPRLTTRSGDGMGSLLAMPLIARNEVLGALFVTRNVTHGFEQDDVAAISTFAAQAALALDHARLFAEQIEKERLAREISIAREVQQRLLPQHLPLIQGTRVAASSVFAQEVGGDYYDFIQLDDDRVAFIIADVSGKGTHAAFYMAEMQGIFQSVSRLTNSPVEFLAHANEALSRCLDRHIFITVIYGVLDLKREEFRLARAGHCPAAFISLDGSARFLRSNGLGLGLDRSNRFCASLTEERIKLQPGDVFVLYTDGVVESRSRNGEEYGYDRLLDALKKNRHEEAQQLHDALLDDLRNFTGHELYDDDMTMLVLKWHGITRHANDQLPQVAGAAVATGWHAP